MSGQHCRNCRYWDKPLGKRALSGNVFPCSAPMPPVKLPESVTGHYATEWPPRRKYMERDEGQRCPVWERSVLKDAT